MIAIAMALALALAIAIAMTMKRSSGTRGLDYIVVAKVIHTNDGKYDCHDNSNDNLKVTFHIISAILPSLGRRHLGCVAFPPFCSAVLEPNLQQIFPSSCLNISNISIYLIHIFL